MISKRSILLLGAIGVWGCDSTLPVTFVATEVSVSPSFAVTGQTVQLTVRATNWGEERVYPNNGCAPGLGFSVTLPDLREINPYPAAWPCESEDSHILEPGETDSVVFDWTLPQLTGAYEVVGGVVMGDRLWALSDPVTIDVRAPD